MEILISKGIDLLHFGADQAQVIQALGQPDKVEESEGAKRLQFFDLQIVIALEDEHEKRFGWIEVKNPDAVLFGEKLMGASPEMVLPVISSQIAETPEHEDYGSLETYFYENHWLELQFELNRLRSINLGFLWTGDGSPRWP